METLDSLVSGMELFRPFFEWMRSDDYHAFTAGLACIAGVVMLYLFVQFLYMLVTMPADRMRSQIDEEYPVGAGKFTNNGFISASGVKHSRPPSRGSHDARK